MDGSGGLAATLSVPPDRIVLNCTPVIIWLAALTNLEQAIVLGLARDADRVTNTVVLMDLFDRWLLIAMLLGFGLTSVLACAGKVRSLTGLILCLWPQQAILTIAALGAVHAIWIGAYADGRTVSSMLMLQDQAPLIWFVIGHGLAVWQLIRFMRRA